MKHLSLLAGVYLNKHMPYNKRKLISIQIYDEFKPVRIKAYNTAYVFIITLNSTFT